MTFGPFSPGVSVKRPWPDARVNRGGPGWTLRFYETKEKQRAVFTDVLSFRDESLVIEHEVSREVIRVAAEQRLLPANKISLDPAYGLAEVEVANAGPSHYSLSVEGTDADQ